MTLFHAPSVQSPKAYDLQNLSAQQLGARNNPANATEVGGLAPVDFRFPIYPLYECRRQGCVLDGVTNDYAAFNKVISVASVLGLAIVIDGPMLVGTNITIPSNVQVWFTGAGLIKPSAGITVTINGPVHADNKKIFDLSNAGALVAGSMGGTDLVIQWWGCIADGDYGAVIAGTDNSVPLQQCLTFARARSNLTSMTANRIKAPSGVYRVNSAVTIGDGITFQGSGMWSTIFFAPNAFADAGGFFQINGTTGSPTFVSDMAVSGQTNGANGAGGIICTKNGVFLTNLWCSAWVAGAGISLGSTDNYAHGCVCELNQYGFKVVQYNCSIQHGTTYQNAVAGIFVDNHLAVDGGRVHIIGMRCIEDSQQGISLSQAQRVTIDACTVFDHLNTKFSDAGIRIDVSNDIIISNSALQLHAATAGTNSGISMTGACTNIRINGVAASNWRDGISAGANGATIRLTITGCDCSGNTRHGINVFTGDEVLLSGNTCAANGNTGIVATHSLNAGKWGIIGNRASGNITGYALTCGATMFINFVGNTYNGNTTNITKGGTVANINDVGSF